MNDPSRALRAQPPVSGGSGARALSFDPAAMAQRDRYKLLIGLVIPRPIALVTTLGPTGVVNAAPFSFFNLRPERGCSLLDCLLQVVVRMLECSE